MKCIYKLVAYVLLVSISLGCFAQQMVQTPADLLTVCQKDEQFIGKPLKTLFNQIKPPIILTLADGGSVEQAPHFTFFFTSVQVYEKYRQQDKFPLRIRVYVKEIFKWKWVERNRSIGHYLDWLKEDEEKYCNLTVTAIRVVGDYDPCDYEFDINL